MTADEPAPLVWRAMVAEVFAEAERRGLGRFEPTFTAAPGRRLLARAFVDHRCQQLAQGLVELGPLEPADVPAAAAAHRRVP